MQSFKMEPYPLHRAAKFGDLEKVKELLESGVTSKVNPQEYTPLHCAAMAIKPNEQIAKLFIDFNGTEWLNKQTEDSRDTALHIAAANVNVTESFIQQFKKADSKLLNCMKDTAFHVAAKSHNQETVIYMLNTFVQTINHSNVNEMDEHFLNSLIKVCATSGNAKAVELLIGYGADISQGVLHEIVLESVRKPSKMDELMAVYQTIVDNAITWRGLKENDVFFSSWRSDSPMRHLRETMVWLLTNSLAEYDDTDVLQFALNYGADEMLWRIINTKYVFRIDGKDFCKWFGVPERDPPKDCHWTMFDVTNFTQHTFSKSGQQLAGRNPRSDGAVELSYKNLLGHESQQAKPKIRDFQNPERPRYPYLVNLLLASRHWKEKDILNRQPFMQLTEPYIKLIRSCFFAFGLLQLIFIICFTALQMPTKCSLARMFNISATNCTSDNNIDTDIIAPSGIGRHRSWIALFWLMWPAILIFVSIFIIVQYIKQEAFEEKSTTAFHAKTFIDAFLQSSFPVLSCVSLFIWLLAYFVSESVEWYLSATAFVLLFGWFAILRFFEVGTESISILGLLLHEILSKDMSSFMPHFLCIIVGFAFAMHALRTAACTASEDLNQTFFKVLSSAFGIGDFYGGTMKELTCAAASLKHLFEIMYFFYVSVIILIMLNILIAMMNLRYSKTKEVAGNVLRFQLLSVMTALEDHEKVVKVLKKFRLLNVPDVTYGGDSFRDDDNDDCGYLCFNNRYYLQMVLPANEQL